jgi:hypothetical protein
LSPAPVMTATSALSSSRKRVHASMSSPCVTGPMQLRTSGRLIVMTLTGPWLSYKSR